MSTTNVPLSSLAGGNVGVPSDDTRLGIVQSILITPIDFSLPKNADGTIDDLQDVLEAATIAESNARIFPLHGIQGNEKQTVERAIGTSGYGNETVLKDEIKAYRFELDAGVGYSNTLKKLLHNRNMRVYCINERGQIVGTAGPSNSIRGRYSKIFVSTIDFTDGNDVAGTYLLIDVKDLAPAEANELEFINPDFAFSTLDGVLDAEIINKGTAAGTVSVQLRENISKVDLTSTYSTELAAAGVWVLTNRETGAVITPSGVTYSAGDNTIDIATGLAPGSYMLRLNTVATSALVAADIKKIEGLGLNFEIIIS